MSDLVHLRAGQLDKPTPTVSVSAAKSGSKLPESNKETDNIGRMADVKQSGMQQKNEVGGEAQSKQEVESAVSNLNEYVQTTERKLNFSLDEESGLTVVKVFDAETEELIRQLPSEDAVTLAQKLNRSEPLMLFSAQV